MAVTAVTLFVGIAVGTVGITKLDVDAVVTSERPA